MAGAFESKLNVECEAEKIEKAHFMGVSIGSLLAQHFVYNYPDIALSLTSVGGYPIYADNQLIENAQKAEQKKWIWKTNNNIRICNSFLTTARHNVGVMG